MKRPFDPLHSIHKKVAAEGSTILEAAYIHGEDSDLDLVDSRGGPEAENDHVHVESDILDHSGNLRYHQIDSHNKYHLNSALNQVPGS